MSTLVKSLFGVMIAGLLVAAQPATEHHANRTHGPQSLAPLAKPLETVLSHLFHGRPGSQMSCWEEGAGWSLFPARPDADFTHSIDGVALDDLWVGTDNHSLYGETYAVHWDGEGWTSYAFQAGNYSRCVISTAGGNAVFLGMGSHLGSSRGSFWRFTGSAFLFLWQGPLTFEAQDVFPLAISSSLCYFIYSATDSRPLWRWTSGGGVEQIPAGRGLPNAQPGGICKLGDDLFLLFANGGDATGSVYRGTWDGGFVLDNATDGPFTPMPGTGNVFWDMMSAAADGSTVCVFFGQNFWIRNGPDDWTNVGPTGVTGTSYQPAMANRQILLATSANLTRWSHDGGGTWQSSSYILGQTGGAWAINAAVTSVGDMPAGPVALGAPYPNPSRDGAATFAVQLTREEAVTLELYDMAGRRLALRAPERLPAGTHSLAWKPLPLAAGLYLVRVRTESGTAVHRWVVLSR